MAELYLIAHKVRGEPAFDIAERITIGDEEGWIIPTSGHRAHPYAHWNLSNAYFEGDMDTVAAQLGTPPDPWPDHYPTAAEPRNAPNAGHGLLARLGLLRAREPIKRRI